MLNWKTAVRLFVLLLLLAAIGVAQTQPPAPAASAANMQMGAQKGMMLLTVFLKHDESKPLGKINAELEAQGYYKAFPPAGVEVVSWYVMMGIGQVVTLRFPAERLREVNVALERTAWGAFRTEFFPTYDYKPVWEADQKQRQQAK